MNEFDLRSKYGDVDPFSMSASSSQFLGHLNLLTHHHKANSPTYSKMVDLFFNKTNGDCLDSKITLQYFSKLNTTFFLF